MAQSEGLTGRRCLNHPAREAAAICPQCRRFFCRECVAEHADRILCAACLATPPAAPSSRAGPLGRVVPVVRLLAGLLLAWFYFYLVGQALLMIPDPVHGTAPGSAPAGATAGEPPAGAGEDR